MQLDTSNHIKHVAVRLGRHIARVGRVSFHTCAILTGRIGRESEAMGGMEVATSQFLSSFVYRQISYAEDHRTEQVAVTTPSQ